MENSDNPLFIGKKQNFSNLFLLLLLELCVLAGAVYFMDSLLAPPAYDVRIDVKKDQANPDQLQNNTTVSDEDLGNGWKKYVNTQYGYTMEYPTDIYIRMNCIGEGLDLDKKEFWTPASQAKAHDCSRDTSYDFETLYLQGSSLDPIPPPNKFTKVNQSNLVLDGMKATMYEIEITHDPNANPNPNDMGYGQDFHFYWIYIPVYGTPDFLRVGIYDLENKEVLFKVLNSFKRYSPQVVLP